MLKSLILTFLLLSTSHAVPKCGVYTYNQCINEAEICMDKEVTSTQQNSTEVKEKLPDGFGDSRLLNSVEIYEKNCEKFPPKLKLFFANLEIIKISKSGMKEVKKFELEIFPKLREIDLSENEISTLGSDLFDGNLELEVINFSGNKLTNVGFNLLIPPLKLRDAKFFRNPCINEAHRGNFDDLIEHLRTNCPTTDDMLQRECVAKILESESLSRQIWVRNGSKPGQQPPASLYAKCTVDNLHFHYNEVERLQRELDRLDGKPEKPRRCNINKTNPTRDENCISSGNYHPMEQRPVGLGSSYSEN